MKLIGIWINNFYVSSLNTTKLSMQKSKRGKTELSQQQMIFQVQTRLSMVEVRCIIMLIPPFAVTSDIEIWLWVNYDISSIHVPQYPSSVFLFHALELGMKQSLWKYMAILRFILSSYTFLALLLAWEYGLFLLNFSGQCVTAHCLGFAPLLTVYWCYLRFIGVLL